MTDKKEILAKLIATLELDLEQTKAAARATQEAATNEESKPENEYDTRALEAGYLASAQSKRAGEIEESLFVLRECRLRDFTNEDPIGPTALVCLEAEEKSFWVMLLPAGAGTVLTMDQSFRVQIVTAKSPLGEALMGLRLGDLATVDRARKTIEYEVTQIR